MTDVVEPANWPPLSSVGGESLRVVVVERHGPVGWLLLNRPEVGNAMNAEMLRDLEVAWRHLNSDPEVKVIVTTGVGKAFQTIVASLNVPIVCTKTE